MVITQTNDEQNICSAKGCNTINIDSSQLKSMFDTTNIAKDFNSAREQTTHSLFNRNSVYDSY